MQCAITHDTEMYHGTVIIVADIRSRHVLDKDNIQMLQL